MNLEKIKGLEITRSFSKKIQLEQYEPIEVFASVKAELSPVEAEEAKTISRELHEFVTAQVERDIEDYYKYQKAPF